MMKLIREQRLGFVAAVNADGTPNLSPKGTFVIVDAATVAFGEIRSPGTLGDLGVNPALEVNFVDAFTRHGCRLFGTAHAVQRGEPRFDELLRLFADYGGLVPRIRAIVLIAVTRGCRCLHPLMMMAPLRTNHGGPGRPAFVPFSRKGDLWNDLFNA